MLDRRPVDLANEARMMRSTLPGVSVIVEGGDDRSFYRPYFSQECHFTLAQGKEKVLAVLRILQEHGFPGVVGFIDADFDRLTGHIETNPDLIYNDDHDLESMLVFSQALNKIVDEF